MQGRVTSPAQGDQQLDPSFGGLSPPTPGRVISGGSRGNLSDKGGRSGSALGPGTAARDQEGTSDLAPELVHAPADAELGPAPVRHR